MASDAHGDTEHTPGARPRAPHTRSSSFNLPLDVVALVDRAVGAVRNTLPPGQRISRRSWVTDVLRTAAEATLRDAGGG